MFRNILPTIHYPLPTRRGFTPTPFSAMLPPAARAPRRAERCRGFTLIELLVVVTIIGLLSSVVLASLSDARERARDVKRVQDIKQVKTALELYYSSNNGYPSVGSDDTGYDLSHTLPEPSLTWLKHLHMMQV